MPDQLVYVVPFSHLDLFWLGEREECLSRGNRIISRAMALCERYPSFRFLLEDMVFVRNYLASHPEKREELARLVHEGRIEVAPKYAGIYASMIPGEAHVRNFLYGKRMARELLDVDPQVAHQGDLPAHTPQYPQMLRQAGVRTVIICRLGPNQTPLFWWEALDGERVLTWYSAFSYGWGLRLKLQEGVEAARAAGLEEQAREVLAQTPMPILMHWGTDLLLPTEKLVESVEAWNRASDLQLRLSTPNEFFRAVEATPDLPVIRGESPNGWGMNGGDTYPGDGRYLDGQAVSALTNAERFATISSLLGYTAYPAAELHTAWLRLLEAMDHNANGTGSDEGNRRHLEYRRGAIFTGQEILRNALRPIAENVPADGADSVPLVAFNGLSWERDDIARGHVAIHGDISAFQRDQTVHLALFDAAGREVPCQILDDKAVITREVTVVYRAQRVPSVGYTTYSLRPVQEATAWPATCQVTDEGQLMPLRLETDAFSFVLHRQNGHVDLYDKALGRWVLQGAAFVGEETDLEKRTHAFDHIRTGREFPLAVDSAELLENGPVQARVVVRGLLGTIKVEQEWTLYQGVRRVDLTVTTEGPGRIPAALQQTFPTGIAGGRVCFGVPYGANTFENVMPQLEPKVHNRDESNHDAWVNLREVQDWVDISNGSYGVCIATGHRMTEIVAPTILAKLAFGLVPPERRTYRFRIHPHSGDWRAAKAYRWGCQLASPLAVLSVNDPFTEKRLTKEQSFCSLSADHVVLTVLKRSEDGQQLVWRGYEAEGKDTTMALRFFRPLGLGHLAKTNLLEEQATAVDAEDIPVRPYEIVTLTERNNA